ncbi:MAG: hypothetical protein OXH72_16300 [Caldilineaceae bacterium]|nr:hypothetical protein [Caldilineaceae bacterium]
MTEGKRANRSGFRLEAWVRDVLEERGYNRVSPKEFMDETAGTGRCFSTQCPIGESIYGTTRRADFVLRHPELWEDGLVIQCKWQASSGSVDEKYPYEVACINHLSFPTIIVLDGGGYKPGAKEWLLGQAGVGNLRHVFDMGQFARFCSRGEV